MRLAVVRNASAVLAQDTLLLSTFLKRARKKGARWLIVGKNNFAQAVLRVKSILASCG